MYFRLFNFLNKAVGSIVGLYYEAVIPTQTHESYSSLYRPSIFEKYPAIIC